MKTVNVKIQFNSNPRVLDCANTLLFDSYESIVRAEISKGNNVSRTFYIRPMPKSEMDQIISELCTRITWDGYASVALGGIERRYVFSGEPNVVDLVSEATYCFTV